MELDKTKSKIFIDYFMEDFKILVKVPLKKDDKRDDNNLIVDKFDISNKIYLTHIIEF